MIERDYPINVICPQTGEPCELLVQFVNRYTADHKKPETPETKKLEDVAILNRILAGYVVLRTCQKPEHT